MGADSFNESYINLNQRHDKLTVTVSEQRGTERNRQKQTETDNDRQRLTVTDSNRL